MAQWTIRSACHNWVGIQGDVLNWFRSFLSEGIMYLFIYFCRIGTTYSPVASLTCGVPQGSILEPLLFSLLVFALGSTMENRASSPIFLQVIDKCMCHQLFECIKEIKAWMSSIFFIFKISFNSIVKAG